MDSSDHKLPPTNWSLNCYEFSVHICWESKVIKYSWPSRENQSTVAFNANIAPKVVMKEVGVLLQNVNKWLDYLLQTDEVCVSLFHHLYYSLIAFLLIVIIKPYILGLKSQSRWSFLLWLKELQVLGIF